MDTQKPTFITTDYLRHHPAHLLVGNQTAIAPQVMAVCKQLFCSDNGCNACSTCIQISQKQHPDIRWFTAEKQYTLEQLQPLFDATSFAIEHGHYAIAIIEHAELLSHACSNKLLKLLEEPPHGYRFMLITNAANSLLPTIRSRCLITYSASGQTPPSSPLIGYFTTNRKASIEFLAALEKEESSEATSLILLDAIVDYWNDKHAKAIGDNQDTQAIRRIINTVMRALEQPPMPGSSKVFLKNLYLSLSML